MSEVWFFFAYVVKTKGVQFAQGRKSVTLVPVGHLVTINLEWVVKVQITLSPNFKKFVKVLSTKESCDSFKSLSRKQPEV